jgi:uncharacterized protein (TIGR00730 family)
MVVALLVYVQLKSESDLQQFLDDISALYKHVRSAEGQTLTYEIHRLRSDRATLVILERYADDDALDKIHNGSTPFLAFSGRLRQLDYIVSVRAERMEEPEEALRLTSATSAAASEKGVLVFCGSRNGARPQYVAEAEALGRELSKRGLFLVYGAGTVGIMGALAKSFLAAEGPGAIIKSVIPRALAPKEVSGEMIGEVILTNTMAERKTVLFAHAKQVIALPGGLGTFDELLEALTLQQLGAIRVKIGILNVNKYFDPFLAMVENAIAEGFVEAAARGYFVVAETSAELLDAMEKQEYPVSYNLKW